MELRHSEKVTRLIHEKENDFWVLQEKKTALALFRRSAESVPAYKDFLRKHHISAEKIKTWKDFEFVPETNKEYLRSYPLSALCWQNTLTKKSIVFSSSSGSTGAPFYFPRNEMLNWQYSTILEEFLRKGPQAKENPSTLVIICFGMGVWVGGMITYQAFQLLSERGHPLAIITPGVNKEEILNTLKNVAPLFEQVILVGYPPFIKDVIDDAYVRGIDIKKIMPRIIFAAEAFTERFRKYIVDKVGIQNPYRDTLNIYGSADIGAMAYETGISILAKQIALGKKELARNLFHQTVKSPTFAQYNPSFIHFEEQNQRILLTGDSVIPLIRYAIGDCGGVITFSNTVSLFQRHDIDLQKKAAEARIPNPIPKFPFVYIYERIDLSTKLYGAIIYPEPIREVLQNSVFEDRVTGKFMIATKSDKKHNQYLEINVELKSDITASIELEKKIVRLVVQSLLEKNGEYKNNYTAMPHRMIPQLVFWPYEHPKYFRIGIKQKWVE
ncbi:MAG: hypothetical protein Q8R30_00470 [bacterium]|nr:hypothetical protein [bacterium]